jgi:hypothetical protein
VNCRTHEKLYEVDERIRSYFRTFPSRPKDEIYFRSLIKARHDFKLPQRVKIRHVNDVIRHYPHPDRSPGLPYTKRGIRKKSEVDTNIIRWNIHKIKYGIKKFKVPCTAAKNNGYTKAKI